MPAVVQIPSAVVLVTPPSAPDDLPITVDALKSNCGFATSDTDFDSIFRRLILEATNYVEQAARNYIRPVTLDEQFEYFPPSNAPFRLSRSPVRSITNLTYYDVDGVLQTLDSSTYSGWLGYNPPLVTRRGTDVWPSTKCGYTPACTIRYEAGPATVADAIPGLTAAVMLIATATYQNNDGRERSGPLVIPQAAMSMIMATSPWGYM